MSANTVSQSKKPAKPTKPQMWTWLISPDANGNPIGTKEIQALTRHLGKLHPLKLIRDDHGNPLHLTVVKKGNAQYLQLADYTGMSPNERLRISAFLDGYCFNRTPNL